MELPQEHSELHLEPMELVQVIILQQEHLVHMGQQDSDILAVLQLQE